MLARRIRRDVQDRGRSVDGVLEQYVPAYYCVSLNYKEAHRYLRFVKPAFDNFVGPSSKFADIVRVCFLHATYSWQFR